MLIYQTDAYKQTVESVVTEFCNSYWDKPRRFKWVVKKGNGTWESQFKLTDGIATYAIQYNPHEQPPVYQIYRLN